MFGLKRPARFSARAPRTGVIIETELLLPDDRMVAATVRNLSGRGFHAICDVPLRAGTWLGVDLPGYGIARAVVRWYEEGDLGCEFRKTLPEDAIDHSVGLRPLFRSARPG